jgi:hypothetical protein
VGPTKRGKGRRSPLFQVRLQQTPPSRDAFWVRANSDSRVRQRALNIIAGRMQGGPTIAGTPAPTNTEEDTSPHPDHG